MKGLPRTARERSYRVARDADGVVHLYLLRPLSKPKELFGLGPLAAKVDNFDAGTRTAGASLLAWTILEDAFDKKTAANLHEGFKSEIVATWRFGPSAFHAFTWRDVKKWVDGGGMS